jgi:hypothetical protein
MKMRSRRWRIGGRNEIAAHAGTRLRNPLIYIKIRSAAWVLLVFAFFAGVPLITRSQAISDAVDFPDATAGGSPDQPVPAYSRPTEKAKFRNYTFDAFGPYPVIVAGFAAGINQLNNTPPEWHQGAEGYGKRMGSDFGIAVVSTTTRYALSEAFKEDELYYRCECQGVFPRLRHAAFSTLTARRGRDGHRVFSVPALVAPYAGSMTAVYGWYPDRYGAKDALRMGNYSLIGYVGGNIAMEFLYSGPHSLFSRIHLGRMRRGSDDGSIN